MTIPRDRDGGIDWQTVRERLDRRSDASVAVEERERAVLAERARILARVPAAAPDAGDVLDVVVLALGRERFAIESRFVREIVRLSEITPVPGAPEALAGVTNLRGEILGVFDLAKLFGLPAGAPGDLARLLVLGRDRTELGVLADAICEGAALRADELRDAQTAAIDDAVPLRGVTRDGLQVLDGESLLQDARLFIDQGEV